MRDEIKFYKLDADEINSCAYAIISTNKGDMKFKLYPEETPQNVANFAFLAKEGFYDGLIFHRVIPGFVAQGGCPIGSGTGGPGWCIVCECDDQTHRHKKGTLSMAHAGKDTGGSQFFICFAPQMHLDGVHTVFGDMIENDEESFKVLDSLEQNDIIKSIQIKEKI